MSAFMRAIDQVSQILAPALTGQVIHFTELYYGALVIAGWNLASVFLEYYLIWKVYESVPALKVKIHRTRQDDKKSKTTSENEEEEVREEILDKKTDPVVDNSAADDPESNKHSDMQLKMLQTDASQNKVEETTPTDQIKREVTPAEKKEEEEPSRCRWVLGKMFYSLITLYRGWRTFMKYEVAFAGIGLACLYMTVLGFDNITIGFAFNQGLSSAVLGGLQTAGALSGILGTILYPRVRMRIGTERTGLVSLAAEILCLCLCVASVWTPGSPSDFYWSNDKKIVSMETCRNSTDNLSLDSNLTYSVVTASVSNVSDISTIPSYTVLPSNQTTDCSVTMGTPSPHSQMSIWLLMSGIILARCGLWMADLTITQLFLERVVEEERGIVGGVQSSLNKLMDMLKFLLVIIFAEPNQFGLLVIISFAFICLAWVSYAKFSRLARGHLFHFDKMKQCCDAQNNNIIIREGLDADQGTQTSNKSESIPKDNQGAHEGQGESEDRSSESDHIAKVSTNEDV